MTDRWSQWKANVALRIPLVLRLRLFSPTLSSPHIPHPPALLPAIPAGAHFTFTFTSHQAPLALSSLSISAGWTDAQESRQRRTELTQQTSHHRPPPPPRPLSLSHPHHHSLSLCPTPHPSTPQLPCCHSSTSTIILLFPLTSHLPPSSLDVPHLPSLLLFLSSSLRDQLCCRTPS